MHDMTDRDVDTHKTIVMSTCSVATGLLTTVAIVHFAITAILSVLIAVFCYYGKRKDSSRFFTNRATEDSLSQSHSSHDGDSSYKSGVPVEDEKQKEAEFVARNDWADSTDDLLDDNTTKEDLRRESFDLPQELVLRKVDSPRTTSPLTASPHRDGGTPRKRHSIDIISNLSNKFRRISSAGVVVDDAQEQLVQSPSRTERESSSSSCEPGLNNQEEEESKKETYPSEMTLTINFSSEGESSC